MQEVVVGSVASFREGFVSEASTLDVRGSGRTMPSAVPSAPDR
jgi:hypothetical protein